MQGGLCGLRCRRFVLFHAINVGECSYDKECMGDLRGFYNTG